MFVEDDDAPAGLGAEDAAPATNNKKVSLPPLVPGFKASSLDAGKNNSPHCHNPYLAPFLRI